MKMEKIILFDGYCSFCSDAVQFIIKRDPHHLYQFASLQSEVGKQLLSKYSNSLREDSLVYIDNQKLHMGSSAAFHICKNLTGFWKFLYSFIIIPKPIRDFFYRLVSKNRYRISHVKNRCYLPSPGDRKRFL